MLYSREAESGWDLRETKSEWGSGEEWEREMEKWIRFWTFDFVFIKNETVLTWNWNALMLGGPLISYNIKLLIYI